MSLSHYNSHIQPLGQQHCLFWEHNLKKKKKRPLKSPWLPQVWLGSWSEHGGHCKHLTESTCVGRFWMHTVSEISSHAASVWREAQGTCPGHSTLSTAMDIGQGTKSKSAKGGIPYFSKLCHPQTQAAEYVTQYSLHHTLFPASEATMPSLMQTWSANRSRIRFSILLFYEL